MFNDIQNKERRGQRGHFPDLRNIILPQTAKKHMLRGEFSQVLTFDPVNGGQTSWHKHCRAE